MNKQGDDSEQSHRLVCLLCRFLQTIICIIRRIQHIFYENSVSLGGIGHKDVSHGSDELAVLDYRGARHECGQEGTTVFYNFLTILTLFVKKFAFSPCFINAICDLSGYKAALPLDFYCFQTKHILGQFLVVHGTVE